MLYDSWARWGLGSYGLGGSSVEVAGVVREMSDAISFAIVTVDYFVVS